MKRVKKFSLMVLFTIWAAALFAQYSFGFKTSVVFPQMEVEVNEYEPDDRMESNTGFSIAFIQEIGISEHFAIQPEIAWVQKGVSEEYPSYDGTHTIANKMRLNYMEIPVLAKFKLDHKDLRTYVMGGPTFGYAVTGHIDPYRGSVDKIKGDDWDGFSRFEVGVNLGLGVGWYVGPGTLFLDARWMRGLTNLNDIDLIEDDLKISNKGIMLSFGFMSRPFY